jgi:hypothetical protein
VVGDNSAMVLAISATVHGQAPCCRARRFPKFNLGAMAPASPLARLYTIYRSY